MPEPRQEQLPGNAIPGDEVHVFIASLEVDADALRRLELVLSPEERERAFRLRFERDRRRFVAAHGFLRGALAPYLGCAPSAIVTRNGANGKPELASERPVLRFNLAHSHELAACAVAADREVGIDVEALQGVAEAGLARRILSEREHAVFRALEAEVAEAALLAAWTRKEAVLKARGEGLRREPAEVEVSFEPERPARVIAIAGDPGAELRWSVQELDVGTGYIGAVAAEGEDWVVRRRIWDPGS